MSNLHQAAKEFVAMRRSLGFKLRSYDGLLAKFVDFLDKEGAGFITTRLAVSWATLNPDFDPATCAQRLGVVRLFARHLSAFDPRTEVPPHGVIPSKSPRKLPYLYTSEEVVALMEAARRLRPPRGTMPEDALRPSTYSTLLGLLAVTGLRFGEVLNLQRNDVELGQCLLTVRLTKFGKSRLVPLHETTGEALKQYAQQRDRLHPVPRSPHFFVGQQGGRLDRRTVKTTFISLSRQIGLRSPTESRGPRLHDLRHTFAVRTVIDWYRAGLNVEAMMPRLSTYLGHAHTADTYWYLSASAELLMLASERLEQSLGGAS